MDDVDMPLQQSKNIYEILFCIRQGIEKYDFFEIFAFGEAT